MPSAKSAFSAKHVDPRIIREVRFQYVTVLFTIPTMTSGWQECIRPDPADRRTVLWISLNRKGDLAMNAAAWEYLGAKWFYGLFYDAGKRLIGLKPAMPDTPNAFRVRG